MDVNNTKFHLLTGKADWEKVSTSSVDSNLFWDQKRNSLSLKPLLFRFRTRPLLNVDLAFQADLDGGLISTQLRGEFEKNSVSLSQNLSVSVEIPGSRWLITDSSRRYVVRREGDRLNIYPHLLRPENRRGAGRDMFANWYWIADDETGLRFLPGYTQNARDFWSVGNLVTTCDPEVREAGAFEPCRPPHPPEPLRLRGLAVTEHHYLVVGVLEPPGTLIFDLHAGGPPIQVLWPAEVPFAPFDMAPAPGGGVWILDLYDPDLPRYWALDANFRVITTQQGSVTIESPAVSDFRPVTGDQQQKADRTFPTGIDLTLSSPLAVTGAIAIEGLPDGSVLILATPPELPHSIVYRYCFGELRGQADLELFLFPVEARLQAQLNSGSVPTELLSAFEDDKIPLSQNATVSIETPDEVWRINDADFDQTYTVKTGEDRLEIYAPLKAHDFAFLRSEGESSEVTGTLYVAEIDGNQAFAFDLRATEDDLQLELQRTRYFPMRRFGGKALVSGGDAVYYDFKERWFPLVEHRRPRYNDVGVGKAGRGKERIFDSRKPDCVWHRIFLDAAIPPGAQVQIESRAANDIAELKRRPWQFEPDLYLRAGGAELPYYHPYSPEMEKLDGIGTWELLLQRAKGRYLQLRLTLRGTGQNTPRIRALRVYYPRFSYLNEYLPALYREDETSASFLDRFLANAEGVYTALEDRIAQAQFFFDVRTIPEEDLEWLAGWFGVILDGTWSERRRRLFIKYAPQLFNERGTVSGLIRSVRLATDPCPDESIFEEEIGDKGPVRIVENYLTRRAPGVVFGNPTDVEGPGITTELLKWTPEQGAERLHQDYREYLEARYGNISGLNQAWGTEYANFDEISMSPVQPSNIAEADDWERFLRVSLGFTYAPVTAADEQAYRDFLARRYRRIDSLKDAYQLPDDAPPTAFQEINLPAEDDMPSGGIRLFDWIQFVSLALPIRRNAHRFTVLVPIDPRRDSIAQQDQLEQVRRIVELEKPAHTTFELRGYWDFFRVGEARLGIDTAVGFGSRFTSVVVGRSFLADGYLYPSHPMNVQERLISDRDRLGDMPAL